MRYQFNHAPMWSDELLGYSLVALIMAEVTEAYRRHDHIAIDLLTSRLSARHARAKEIWGDLCVTALALVLLHAARRSADLSCSFGFYPIGPPEAPMWSPMIPVVLGFALLALMAAGAQFGACRQACIPGLTVNCRSWKAINCWPEAKLHP